ncbi:hypothetical protein IF2G_00535 [Cordyceps javanica]|nr:hypothetical protein IF2G_00535 [Cordyceps javanica]
MVVACAVNGVAQAQSLLTHRLSCNCEFVQELGSLRTLLVGALAFFVNRCDGYDFVHVLPGEQTAAEHRAIRQHARTSAKESPSSKDFGQGTLFRKYDANKPARCKLVPKCSVMPTKN